jgi:hypothetical protein
LTVTRTPTRRNAPISQVHPSKPHENTRYAITGSSWPAYAIRIILGYSFSGIFQYFITARPPSPRPHSRLQLTKAAKIPPTWVFPPSQCSGVGLKVWTAQECRGSFSLQSKMKDGKYRAGVQGLGLAGKEKGGWTSCSHVLLESSCSQLLY